MSVKLNLGAGDESLFIPGYQNLDRKTGDEIYPLAFADSSVSSIRASHCLEHFGHRLVPKVIKDWVRALEPGGILQIAVPDFNKIIGWYQAGREDLPLHSFLMGGQIDENDYHKSIFNKESLRELLEQAGLTDIHEWTSDIQDAASFAVSLNLQGTKPKGGMSKWPPKRTHNIYSQFGEDGLLEAVFELIGVEQSYCVDVGAADGLLFSNVRQWIDKGWRALLIEADPDRFDRIESSNHIRALNVKVAPAGVSSLDSIFEQMEVPKEFDLLSIDVDGQDYYLWNSLLHFRPRVVVCEYDPDAEPMYIPPLGYEGCEPLKQAGIQAIHYVARARGYIIIAQTRTNLIAVREDLSDPFVKHDVEEVPAKGLIERVMSPSEQPIDDEIRIRAVASVPRLGFNATWHCTITALAKLNVPLAMVEGAFWGQCLSRGIEQLIKDGADYIVTIDYDSIFTAAQFHRLCQLIVEHPEYDAICPVQIKREGAEPLFKLNGSTDFSKELTPISSGHFGLSIFKADAFERMRKPWFHSQPNEAGEWNERRIDDDIWFWRQFGLSGLKVALANEVRIGHLELGITWPGPKFEPMRQGMSEYREHGQPEECGGGLRIQLL